MIKKALIFTLIVIVGLLVFLTASRVKLAFFGETMLAQVGVSLGIPPNPYNSLNDQLNQKSAYLDERQAYLDAEQAALASSTAAANSPAGNPFLLYLTVAVIGLAVLVILNFYFDWRRAHKKRNMTQPSPKTPPAVPPESSPPTS